MEMEKRTVFLSFFLLFFIKRLGYLKGYDILLEICVKNEMGIERRIVMSDRLKMILVMLIWGSVGIFVKGISLLPGQLAMIRGAIGALFLFLICRIRGYAFSKKAIQKNLFLLILSGVAIGINLTIYWKLL